MFVDVFKINKGDGQVTSATNIEALAYTHNSEFELPASGSNSVCSEEGSTATPSEDMTGTPELKREGVTSDIINTDEPVLVTNGRTYERQASLSYFSDLNGDCDRLAVEVRNAHLTYGRGKKAHQALKGINLRVPEGAIYGLLGPSGCGKTTLLNAVIGRFKIKDGYVRVFGKAPGSTGSIIPGRGVGFMPQELALYQEFTIQETLMYFGRLHQIPYETLKNRAEFLLKFLDLPPKGRLVANLSGGQQRRVSLAAALIHQPPLLVLDEPTVGVDPLLRQNIWNHLVQLTSKEGMTVIITTHYIEEARQADFVGLMRKGRLLAEASPMELIKHYQENSLEQCFLKLCMFDKENKNLEIVPSSPVPTKGIEDNTSQTGPEVSNPVFIIADSSAEGTHNNSFAMSSSTIDLIKNSANDLRSVATVKSERNRFEIPPPPNNCVDSCSKILTLFKKNMIRLKRNIAVVLFQFALPAIQVILLCLCVGRNPFNLSVAVVNEESPIWMSKDYLNSIDNHSIVQKHYPDLDSAIDSVKRGETWGAIHIGPRFSNTLLQRYQDGLDATNETITNSSIKLYLDMTNQQIALTLQKIFLESFQTFAQDMLGMIGSTPLIATLPVVAEQPVYGINAVSFTEFIAPGVILSITYIMAVGLTALSFVDERKSGLFDRSWVSGVTAFQVLTSHILTQWFVLVGQVFGLLIFTFLVFEVPSRGPFFWVIAMTLLQGVCGMAFGLLISAMVADENSAIMIAMGSFYPNLILSGIVWPLESQPYFVRYLSTCLPQTLPTEALRAILSKGWDIQYAIVWTGFLVTFAWIAFFLLTAIIIFKLKK